MTVVGLALILVGMVVALFARVAYDGQWLLGLILALIGVGLAWKDRKRGT